MTSVFPDARNSPIAFCHDNSSLNCLVGAILCLSFLLIGEGVMAQQRTVRDAGEQLRHFSTGRISAPSANAITADEQQRSRHLPHLGHDPDIGPVAITIQGVNFVGNKVFDGSALAERVQAFFGRPLTVDDLADAAVAAAEIYHESGYFAAQVVVPPQEIIDGTITMLVLEGYLDEDGIKIDDRANGSTSIEYVRRILSRFVKTGEPIRRREYERALLIVESLPGVHLRSRLYPGTKAGTARLGVEIYQTNVARGAVSYDNFGFYGAGQDRVTVQGSFDNAVHQNEALSLVASTSGRSQKYAGVEASIPVGNDGFVFSAIGNFLDYRLRKEYDTANQRGWGAIAGLHLTYPLWLLQD
ncbi:MAG: hemolysin activation/secretion protein [Paracoccaceae bacterium]|jgi:hemolysin activation/secretion protein